MKNVIALFVAVALAVLAANAAPEVGKPAPDFKLKDTSGAAHSLSDFKGKYVVLEWVNYGCPFVKKHYDSKNMQTLQKEVTGEGAVWLAVCSSAPGKQGHFAPADAAAKSAEYGSAATAYLIDEEGDVGKLYGAKTTPHMFVVNPEGVVVYMGAIDDKSTLGSSSIPEAKNYVKVALAEAKGGKPVTDSSTKPYGCSVKY